MKDRLFLVLMLLMFSIAILSGHNSALPSDHPKVRPEPVKKTLSLAEMNKGRNSEDDGIVVGTGTFSYWQSFDYDYNFARSVSLYRAEEFGIGGVLDKIGWHCSDVALEPVEYRIFVGATELDELNHHSYGELRDMMSLVKEGSYFFDSTGWHIFELDSPVTIINTNLLVAVESYHTDQTEGSEVQFYHSSSDFDSNCLWFQDEDDPDEYDWGWSFRPNILLCFSAPTGDPILHLNTNSIAYGNLSFGASKMGELLLTNIGGGTLILDNIYLDEVRAAIDGFSFDASILPIEIPSLNTVAIGITCNASIEGENRAILKIEYGEELFGVDLSAYVYPMGMIALGEGEIGSYLPVSFPNQYSYTQTIYLADELIGSSKLLTKLAYHYNGNAERHNSDDWEIYIGHTDNDYFEGSYDWIDLGDMVKVYQGNVSIPAEKEWMLIELQIPFVYNGVDNLVIATKENKPGFDDWDSYFYCSSTSQDRSLYTTSTNPINPNQAGLYGNKLRFHPNIHMYFEDIPGYAVLNLVEDSLDFGDQMFNQDAEPLFVHMVNTGDGFINISYEDVEFSGADGNLFSVDVSDFPIQLNLGESFALPIYFTGTSEGDKEAKLSILLPPETFEVSLYAHVLSPDIVVLGSGNQDLGLPAQRNYAYSYSQMIYYAAELGNAGRQIEKISFQYNGANNFQENNEWTIWMYQDAKESFAGNTDWLPVSSMQKVFEGIVKVSPGMEWVDVELDMPYDYLGTQNLIVSLFAKIPNGDTALSYFYGTYGPVNRSMKRVNNVSFNPSSPGNGTRVNGLPNTRIHFGDVPIVPVIKLLPQSVDFGNLLYGHRSATKNVTVINIGSGNLILDENDVEISGPQGSFYSVDNSAFPISLARGERANIPLSLRGNEAGMALATFKASYGGVERQVQLSCKVLPEGYVIIGEDRLSAGLPVNTSFDYSYNQMIYLRDQLGNSGRQIERIAFEWNGYTEGNNCNQWKIWMGHTTKSSFAHGLDYVEEANMRNVFSGTVDIPAVEGWVEVILDLPFVYNGTDNLVVAVLDEAAGREYTQSYFWSSYAGNRRSIKRFRDYEPIKASSPGQGTTDNNVANTQFFFADVPVEPTMVVLPKVQSYNYGMVNAHRLETKSFAIHNIGNSPLVIQNVEFTGRFFGLQDDFIPITLNHQQVFHLITVYAPTESGNHQSSLSIQTNAGTHTIALSGSCFDPTIREYPFYTDFSDAPQDSSDLEGWEQVEGPYGYGNYWRVNYSETNYNRSPRSGFSNVYLQWDSDAYLIRPMYLDKDRLYYLEFYARQDIDYGAQIEAVFGPSNDPDEMVNAIIPLSEVISGDHQHFFGEFSVQESGIYFLGIHGIVAYDPYYLSLDDLTIRYAYDYKPDKLLAITEHSSLYIDGHTLDSEDNHIGIFEGAYIIKDAELSEVPNPDFTVSHHARWQMVGGGILSIYVTTTEDWFAYRLMGEWVTMEGPLDGELIQYDITSHRNVSFEFLFGNGGNPTLPVELSRFEAVFIEQENQVKLNWRTESESQMLGYRLYRGTKNDLGQASIITPSLISATNSSTSVVYEYLDSEVEDGIYFYWLEAVGYSMSEFHGPQSVQVQREQSPGLPLITTMGNAYPNPFKESTKIKMQVKGGETGSFTIYNILGQMVFSKKIEAGEVVFEWNGKDNLGNSCGSGVYFYKLSTPTRSITKKMTIVK